MRHKAPLSRLGKLGKLARLARSQKFGLQWEVIKVMSPPFIRIFTR